MRLSKNRYLNFILWRLRNASDFFNGHLALHKTALRYAQRRAAPRHDLPGELVVSLTSYPARYRFLLPTLQSLLTQSVKPDRVILYLEDKDEAQLPPQIEEMKGRGLEIRTGKNLKSFGKLIPALREYGQAFIATADDDVYYPPEWLAELIEAWKEKRTIVGHYGHYIQIDRATGSPGPCGEWLSRFEDAEGDRDYYLPLGECGILYPPHSLHPDVLDDSVFLDIAAGADDFWFFFMGLRAGSKYSPSNSDWRRINWPDSQASGLSANPDLLAFNDARIATLVKRYGWPPR